MTASPNILAYADRATRVPRRWSRAALYALAWVIASPVLVSFPLLYSLHRGWLPQHFLCCLHPEVALLAFAGMPMVGAAWGAVAIVLIRRTSPRPQGVLIASVAVMLGIAVALIGWGVAEAMQT